MRLIDADALIKAIEDIKLYNVTPNQPVYDMNRVRADELIETINAQPTAYDMKKVVEQLQQQANQYNRRDLELVEKSTEAGIHNKGKACSYEHAIEIVRKGGVE